MEHDKSKHIIGRFGQQIAYSYLVRNNYIILHQNLRLSRDEIDIVGYYESLHILIEVKTRQSKFCETAEYHFSKQKIACLKRAAISYAQRYSLPEDRIRIQGIAIQLQMSNKIANIKHFLSLI